MLSITLILFQAMNPIFASIMVPGLGQMMQGQKSKAQAFFVVEGAVWLSYFGFTYFGKRIDHSARVFAIEHAGANPTRRDDAYYDAVEDYFSSADYNLEVERTASYFFPNDPLLQQNYIEENSYVSEDEWMWDTLASRTYYWERRRQAREHKRRASFMPGFAILNRIVSVVDVLLFKREEKLGIDTSEGRIGLIYRF